MPDSRTSDDPPPPSLRAFFSSARPGRSVRRVDRELDSTRRKSLSTAFHSTQTSLIVDIAEVTFIALCEYGSVVGARFHEQRQAGSLSLRHPMQQPTGLPTMTDFFDRIA